MANDVYDRPGSAYDQDSDDGKKSDPRGDLNQAEQGGGSGDRESDSGAKAASPGSLRGSEESGRGGTGSARGGLYNAAGDNQGRFNLARLRARKTRDRIRRLAKNKWLAGAGLGAAAIVGIIIIILVVLIGAYKVVDFAEHVAAYNFARVTRQMTESTDTITAEKIGVDVADKGVVKSTYAGIKAKYYDTATGKVKNLWSKFDNYRPQKIISNFQHDDTLAFNYRDGKFGRQILDSVTINGAEVGITRGTAKNLIPGYKFAKNISFSREFAPNLNDALKANDIGPITRARVASQIRGELDISLVAWAAGKFTSKTESAAALEIERESVAAAEGKQLTFFDKPGATSEAVTGGASDGLDAAATDVKDKLNASLADDKQAAAIVERPNETPAAVAEALANDASSVAANGLQGAIGGVLSAALNIINPVYKYAVPLCLIYDGSIQKAGPSIDTQSDQLQRSALWVQSASAQQKDGFKASAEAAGATSWKLADITKSNAEKRASGLPVDTSTTLSTEASPTGQYTYTIADYLGPIGNVIDTIGPICPQLTNIWIGVGLGAANIAVQVASLFTGGEATAAEAGGEAAVDATLAEQLSLFDASEYGIAASNSTSFLSRVAIKSKTAGSFAKDFAKSTTKQVIAIGSLTLLAQQLVAAEMGGSHSPTSVGQPYDDGVDAGTNLHANAIEQQQFYGAPMTDSSLTQDDKANKASLALKESNESTYNRYLAADNPDSLLSRAAIMASGYLNRSFFASLVKAGSALFNPLRSFSSVMYPLVSRTSFAAPPVTSANTYYGNVQFGYTPEEEKLMHDTNLTYGDLLANQYTLDQSGKEDEINSTYGKCFDGSESIGEMLSNGDIKRDNNGDVLADDSLCSPKSLGPHNPTYGDLVFRWRLTHNYNNTLDQLSQEQEITTSDSPDDSVSTGAGGLPTGSAQALAKELQPFISSGKLYCGSAAGGSQSANCSDIQNTANGTPVGGSCAVDSLSPHLLGLILGLVKDDGWTLGISSICSDHHSESDGPYGGHSNGSTADFSVQNGATGAAAASNKKFVDDAAALLSSTGGSFGQVGNCHAIYPSENKSNFTTFGDVCNHQHIRAAP